MINNHYFKKIIVTLFFIFLCLQYLSITPLDRIFNYNWGFYNPILLTRCMCHLIRHERQLYCNNRNKIYNKCGWLGRYIHTTQSGNFWYMIKIKKHVLCVQYCTNRKKYEKVGLLAKVKGVGVRVAQPCYMVC